MVLLLLLAAAVVFFLPDFQKHGATESVVPVTAKVISESVEPVAPASQDGSIPLAKTIGVPDALLPPTGLQSAEPTAPVVVQSPVLADSVTTPAGSDAVSKLVAPIDRAPVVVANASASEVLVFKAKAPCWVKVLDAKGDVQILRVFAAGETAGVSGVVPLSVIIGAADAMNIEVRGKPFSLVGIAKDNVARFEVK